MKILGIDSSGMVASVALIEDNCLVAEYTVNNKKTHSQTLLPMLEEIVNAAELELESIDAIAVAAGPGSFTGLRIGCASVKGLALALEKPVVLVPTLEGLAYNMWGCGNLICPIMDARRNQVYTGLYRYENNNILCVMEQIPMDIYELLAILKKKNEMVTFVGDGIEPFQNIISQELKQGLFEFAPAHMNKQRAGSIAFAGLVYYKKGYQINGDDFVPEYLRVSQAERERKEKGGQHE